jgi:hypothetical protein
VADSGKLTSLDALLSGRLLSQNVGVSLVAGASLGAWAYGLAQMARAWVAPGFIPLHDTELQYSYSAAPWLGLIGSNVAGAIQMTIIVLLITFSMGNWLGRTSRQRRVVTHCPAGAFPEPPFVDAN